MGFDPPITLFYTHICYTTSNGIQKYESPKFSIDTNMGTLPALISQETSTYKKYQWPAVIAYKQSSTGEYYIETKYGTATLTNRYEKNTYKLHIYPYAFKVEEGSNRITNYYVGITKLSLTDSGNTSIDYFTIKTSFICNLQMNATFINNKTNENIIVKGTVEVPEGYDNADKHDELYLTSARGKYNIKYNNYYEVILANHYLNGLNSCSKSIIKIEINGTEYDCDTVIEAPM